MSDIEIAIAGARRLEAALVARGATGAGLREKAECFGAVWLQADVRAVSWIARERNRVAHDEGAVLSDRDEYVRTCERLLSVIDSWPADVVPAPAAAPRGFALGEGDARRVRRGAKIFAVVVTSMVVIGWLFAIVVAILVWHPWR